MKTDRNLIKETARSLRKRRTKRENILWEAVRNRKVIRFKNEEIENNLERVLSEIKMYL